MKNKEQVKEKYLHIRMTTKMKNELKELSKQWYLTPSNYIRKRVSDDYSELMTMKTQAEADAKLSDLELLEKLAAEQ